MTKQAQIEIRTRDVKNVPLDVQHLFIIHTDSNGKETVLRGGPDTNMLKITQDPYTIAHVDWVENAPSVVIATGTDAKMQALVDKIWSRAQEINAGNYDYKLPIPGCSPTLCHVQNSNTVVNEMVKAAGVKLELPVVGGKPSISTRN